MCYIIYVLMCNSGARGQVDSLDPGTCLMWIFGSLLGVFWLMFVFYNGLFDRVRCFHRAAHLLSKLVRKS